MTRILLVRHGESVANSTSRYSGQREVPLTPLGLAQQARLRERLRDVPIERVVSSDLGRCRLLAEEVASDHGLTVDLETALRESDFGEWEGLSYDEAMARDRQVMVAFNRDPAHKAPPGGESLEATGTRAQAYLMALLRAHKGREGTLVMMSHGGTLRALLCLLLEIPLHRYWTLRVDSASLTILDFYPMGSIVTVLNDTCHLNGLRT